MPPRVSICVPNLNTRPFLAERFDTIQASRFAIGNSWCTTVIPLTAPGSTSRTLAAREPRARAWQGPRAGTPGSWSPCVREARGDYVYIATSDDTMPPDCLEKLVAALDAHPECDVAHCPLKPIDEHGRCVTAIRDWWRNGSMFADSSGGLRRPSAHSPGPVRRTASSSGRVGLHLDHAAPDPTFAVRPHRLLRVDVGIGWRLQLEHAGGARRPIPCTSPTRGADGASTRARPRLVSNLESAEHAARIDSMIDDAIARCGPSPRAAATARTGLAVGAGSREHAGAPARDRLAAQTVRTAGAALICSGHVRLVGGATAREVARAADGSPVRLGANNVWPATIRFGTHAGAGIHCAESSQRRCAGPHFNVRTSDMKTESNELIVVCGAGGFIGGHLVADLLRQGHTRIRAVDIKPFDEWYQRFPRRRESAARPAGEGRLRRRASATPRSCTTWPPTWAAWDSSRTTARCACCRC